MNHATATTRQIEDWNDIHAEAADAIRDGMPAAHAAKSFRVSIGGPARQHFSNSAEQRYREAIVRGAKICTKIPRKMRAFETFHQCSLSIWTSKEQGRIEAAAVITTSTGDRIETLGWTRGHLSHDGAILGCLARLDEWSKTNTFRPYPAIPAERIFHG